MPSAEEVVSRSEPANGSLPPARGGGIRVFGTVEGFTPPYEGWRFRGEKPTSSADGGEGRTWGGLSRV